MANQAPFRLARRPVDLESLWLLTFADLMVQLMACFAVLYTHASADQRELARALASIRQALVGRTELPEDADRIQREPGVPAELAPGQRQRVLVFRGDLVFREGSTALEPGSEALLRRVRELAENHPDQQLICEGHAAPGERGGAGDALALSAHRAMATQRQLELLGLPAARLRAEAQGDARPQGDVRSPEGRALQRRVAFRLQAQEAAP